MTRAKTSRDRNADVQKGPAVADGPAPHLATYTVEAGDTLHVIAERLYGDDGRWQTLWAANRGVLGDDPDDVVVGQVLLVPA
jgi:nucleoid-associated protein YgaU